MLAGRTIAVVMPAHDEAALIGWAIRAIPDFIDRIVIVDDGSTDDTVTAARRSGRRLEIIAHATNSGVGAAIATGCVRALAAEVDIAIIMAADGQMSSQDLPALLAPLLANECDFVKGNRLDWSGSRRAMPLARWLGNHVFSVLTRWALGTRTRDSQCGYVALSRRALLRVDWARLWPGYGYPNDLLSQAVLRGLRIREVPVRPVYGAERSGIRLKDVCAVIPFVLARAWLRRVRPSAIEAPWRTSTSSTAMPTDSVRSPSSATPSPAKAP